MPMWSVTFAAVVALWASAAPGALGDRVVVASFDGFAARYLPRTPAEQMPNFHRLVAEGGYAREGMVPPTPTKTFPAHYTLITGVYAESHGIVANRMYDPGLNKTFSLSRSANTTDWFQAEPAWITLQKYAREAAVCHWPGSEAFINGQRPSRLIPFDPGMSYDAKIAQIQAWVEEGAAGPDLMMVYFDQPDLAGHEFGPESNETNAKILDADATLGKLRAVIPADVNLIVVSDHGMVEMRDSIDLKTALPDFPWADYISYANNPLANVWARTPAERDALYNALADLAARERRAPNGEEPLFSVWKKENIPARYHLQHSPRVGDVFILAAEGVHLTIGEYRNWNGHHGSHGFDNKYPSMHAIFAAAGPRFRPNTTLPGFESVNVYSLICEVLNIPPAANNGTLEPFAPILRRSPNRAHWRRNPGGKYSWDAEWYPAADAITIYPPHGATVSPGVRFDVAVTLPSRLPGVGSEADIPRVAITRDGVAGDAAVADVCAGARSTTTHPTLPYAQHIWRGCTLNASAQIRVTSGRRSNAANITVFQAPRARQPVRAAKNVILVVGDGMSLPMITATRLLTRGRLPTDDFDHNGLSFTKSLESIVTDSAAGGSALNTGHKVLNGAMGVYPDMPKVTDAGLAETTDNPRVETFAEYVRRTRNMRVGVVTTASLTDATPASVWGHCTERGRANTLALQGLDLQPEVMLGGGKSVFDDARDWSREGFATNPDTAAAYAAAGYTKVTTAAQLAAAVNASTPKLLGLFAPNHLHTANDRRADANNTQPSLPAMATAALALLDRGDDPRGFYLMVEAASIDKQAHGCDYARMLGDSLELQETLAAVGRELGRRGLAEETLVVVTSDHATGGYDVYGTVDTDGVRSVGPTVDYNAEIQMYGQAEWPDWEARDFRVGNWETAQWTFAGVNNNHPSYREDFRPKPRAGWLGKAGEQRQLDGIELSNNLGETEHFEAVHASVHTSSDVMVFANGRGGAAFAGAYENTDVFHKMVAALEPAKRGEPALEALHQAVDVLEANVMRLAALVGEELALPAGKPATPHAAAARLQLLQDHFDRQTQQLHSKILSAEGGHGPGGFEAYPSAHHVPWPDMALAFLILGLLTAYFCTGLFGTVVALFVYTCSCWPWVRRGYSKVDEEEGAGEGVGLAASSSGQPQESLAQRRPQAGYGTGV